MIRKLIIEELKVRQYKSFAEKECNVMYNSIQEKTRISQSEFWEGLSSLVNEGLLLYHSAESGRGYYTLSSELMNKLGLE